MMFKQVGFWGTFLALLVHRGATMCHGTGGNGFPGHLLGIRQAQQDVLADAAGEEDWLLEGFFDARERCQIPLKEWF